MHEQDIQALLDTGKCTMPEISKLAGVRDLKPVRARGYFAKALFAEITRAEGTDDFLSQAIDSETP